MSSSACNNRNQARKQASLTLTQMLRVHYTIRSRGGMATSSGPQTICKGLQVRSISLASLLKVPGKTQGPFRRSHLLPVCATLLPIVEQLQVFQVSMLQMNVSLRLRPAELCQIYPTRCTLRMASWAILRIGVRCLHGGHRPTRRSSCAMTRA